MSSSKPVWSRCYHTCVFTSISRHTYPKYLQNFKGTLKEIQLSILPVELYFLSEFCATVAGLLNISIKGLVDALAEGAEGIFGEYLERVS